MVDWHTSLRFFQVDYSTIVRSNRVKFTPNAFATRIGAKSRAGSPSTPPRQVDHCAPRIDVYSPNGPNDGRGAVIGDRSQSPSHGKASDEVGGVFRPGTGPALTMHQSTADAAAQRTPCTNGATRLARASTLVRQSLSRRAPDRRSAARLAGGLQTERADGPRRRPTVLFGLMGGKERAGAFRVRYDHVVLWLLWLDGS
jgi:hypothetical protein